MHIDPDDHEALTAQKQAHETILTYIKDLAFSKERRKLGDSSSSVEEDIDVYRGLLADAIRHSEVDGYGRPGMWARRTAEQAGKLEARKSFQQQGG